MIDPELDDRIEQLAAMLKNWGRFFALYKKIAKGGDVAQKEVREFADLRKYFSRGFQPLATRIDLRLGKDLDVLRIVAELSGVDGVRELSDMQHRKFQSDWNAISVAMNDKLGELETRRDELAEVSAFTVGAKKFFGTKSVQWGIALILLALVLGLFDFWNRLFDTIDKLVDKL